MTTPLLSVCVPTIGRPGLARTLTSLRNEAPPSVLEILVAGDTHADTWATALAPVPALCAEYSARYLPVDGGAHMVGQFQRQAAMAHARGEWLAFSQDDMAWEPNTFWTIRTMLDLGPTCPHLFRVVPRCGAVVWDQVGILELGHVDADCIVVPNEPARLGRWGLHYNGDHDFIYETVARWDGQAVWADSLIARFRGES